MKNRNDVFKSFFIAVVLLMLCVMFTFLYYSFEVKKLKEEIKKEMTIMAPSITEMKSKLIEVKNNSNPINLNFDNKYSTLTIKKSRDIKNEENISFKIKDILMCEQVYNITNEIFKINSTTIYNYKTKLYDHNKELKDPNIVKNITIIGQYNLKNNIIRYCNSDSIIEFNVVR